MATRKQEIKIRNKFGWKLYKDSNIQLWFSGYLVGEKNVEDILLELVTLSYSLNIDIEKLSKWVSSLSGNFACVVKFSDNSCFLAVDKICSIPVFDAVKENKYAVSNYAPYLKEILDIGSNDINLQSLLEVSMSGFTIDDKTIYNNINRLAAGECVFWNNGKRYKKYYYTYFPCKNSSNNYTELKSEFAAICLTTIKKLIKSVNGRQIVVPLSAGNDSRLIVSCLKELSYENVICFTYGRYGNYEVNTSKKVADMLGYKWVYIQDVLREKRNFFKSTIYNSYIEMFESYASVPNVQDIYEIYTLKTRNIIDTDAVIVNGNSGDFISGGHIPDVLELDKEFLLDDSTNWTLFLDKHYSLWSKLRTNVNDKLIVSQLLKSISKRLKYQKQDTVFLYSVIESMECIGRQSRLVANQQRAYDFIGHEWRLPLWSEDFLSFWEGVPPEYKVNQALYKDVLMENNWGGVWKDINVNNKSIRPYSLYFFRLFAKFVMSPFGKKKWHRIERNIFVYWMHPSYARAVVPYLSVLFDRRGEKNTNSWMSDQFVKRNGFNDVVSVSNKVWLLHKYK
jgi:asparagine synthase (glutamine-hydrolysing)